MAYLDDRGAAGVMTTTPAPGFDIPARFARPAARLTDVVVRYPGQERPALAIDKLEIGRGERVALIGPSGGGKTTLLRLLNGALRAASGSVELLGEGVNGARPLPREQRRRTGMIFQGFALVERATVMQNVLAGRLGHVSPWLSLFGAFSEDDRRLARAAIAEVDLEDVADRRVDGLSGGQRQRVAVARVLAQSPEVILADEPVSQLDPALTSEIIDLLTAATRRRGATLVMAVHQPALAVAHMGRILGIKDGAVLFDGPPDRLTASMQARIYDRDARRLQA